MNIDFIKLENYFRITMCAILVLLAIGALYGIIMGRYVHIITFIGCVLLAYTLAKEKQ